MDPKKTTNEIVKIFRHWDKSLEKGAKTPRSGKGWTREVIKKLSKKGKELGYIVRPSRGKDRGEWLWDLCWHRENNSKFLEEVPLVAESEWGNLNEIVKDFKKLLAARASIRVMVYDAKQSGKGRHTAEEIARKLCSCVKGFHGKRGDIYLLVAAEGKSNPWKYFRIEDRGMKQQPLLQQVSQRAEKNLIWVPRG